MSTIEIITIIISVFAIIFAGLSFWKNYLSPFSLEVTSDSPTFATYKIDYNPKGIDDSKKDKSLIWWIPSFDLGLSFYNKGQKTGKILDLRINLTITTGNEKKKYAFYPRWIVKFNEFNKVRSKRKEWLSSSIVQEWYPQIIPEKNFTRFHLVLESMRWDEPILGKAEINIEYISTKNPEWELIQKHQFEIWDAVYDGNSLTASSEISEKRELFDFDKELKKRHEQNKK